jgi:hypothetical protein
VAAPVGHRRPAAREPAHLVRLRRLESARAERDTWSGRSGRAPSRAAPHVTVLLEGSSLKNPDDIDGLCSSIEQQMKTIFV